MIAGKRLEKSRTNRMIDGICGGLSEYFDIDVTLLRVAFVVMAFLGGLTIIAYITAMIVMPAAPSTQASPHVVDENKRSIQTGMFWGVTLIISGIVFLLEQFDLFSFHWLGRIFSWKWILPVLLIVIGFILIVSHNRFQSVSDGTVEQTGRRFRRKREGKKIWGVCGGIAEHFQWDVSIVRVGWVVLTFLTFPLGIVAYVILAFVTPDEMNEGVFSSKTSGQ